jgi:GNAT superfamily N-acetyltransferase
VAEDAAGVGGYIVGALDSPAFEARLERDWWPRLRKRYPEPPPAVPEGDWTPDQRAAYRIHHPWHAPGELTGRYPSHLHINLVPRLQGHGHGTRLIAALVDSLRGRGSAGVHLNSSLANTRAAAFYRHTGFCELSADGGYLFGMALR